MNIAVLGPGGVGGLVAAALARPHATGVDEGVTVGNTATAPRSCNDVAIVARESTVATISEQGVRVRSVLLGDFTAHPRALARLEEPVDVLIVATKAAGLREALERVEGAPTLVLPLLNGLDHIAVLREHFGDEPVLAGTIRVEADRPEPGVVVHTSQFLRVDMASKYPDVRPRMEHLAQVLSAAGIPARVGDSEPQVMWSKLVRLNALACTTSAYDMPLGEIRSTPKLRNELVSAIEEGCAVANAEGASIPTGDPLGELTAAHATLGSSMQRDIAAKRPPELDAIPGAVLRAAARHRIACPVVSRLVGVIAQRSNAPLPVVP